VHALPLPAYAVIGAIAGSLFSTQILRWVLLLRVSAARHSGDFLGPPKRRVLWALPAIAFLHPAPYMVLAVVFVTAHSFQAKAGPAWLWFLSGFYLNVAYVTWRSLAILHRGHQAPPTGSQT
jgi:hypothetical protein